MSEEDEAEFVRLQEYQQDVQALIQRYLQTDMEAPELIDRLLALN